MKTIAVAVLGLVAGSFVVPAIAAPDMTVVKACVAKEKKELGAVGYGSLQATMFIDNCVRNGGR